MAIFIRVQLSDILIIVHGCCIFFVREYKIFFESLYKGYKFEWMIKTYIYRIIGLTSIKIE